MQVVEIVFFSREKVNEVDRERTEVIKGREINVDYFDGMVTIDVTLPAINEVKPFQIIYPTKDIRHIKKGEQH